uniref:Wzz/FepE/Etk N-terminal domain-containing protein n=1 Tax=Algoriphagus sp. TaxID=1872435 RepID=UPI004048A568
MTDNTPSNSEDEIDLKDLIIPIWRSRKQILTIAAICGILGGIIGFLTPATYTASSTFLPQTAQAGGGLSGSLGGLASLAGINLSTGAVGWGDIPPSMYATVLASEPFRKRILDSNIVVNGDSVAYRTYLESQPGSVLRTIKGYTIGLPGKLIREKYSSEKPKEEGHETGLHPLTDLEFSLQESLNQRISIEIDKNVGFVFLTAAERDPMVAAQLAKVTEKVLQDWIIEHKIKNAKAQYDFIEKQFDAKQKQFFLIQDQLAGYMDRNQNVLSATYLTRLERLQAEFDLVNTVYSELAKQKEQAAIQLSKDTPTFSVLNPVKVPKEKTGPKKSIYVFISFFVGLIFSAGWFLASKPVMKFLKDLQQSTN